jgi:putative transposase
MRVADEKRGQLYAQYVNKRYKRIGYLWQGRFKSCLVQSENYVLACYRYIELNPVRAGITRRPDEYRWSSYAANAMGKAVQFLSPHEEYQSLGRTPAERQAVYRDLFGVPQQAEQLLEIRTAVNGGYVLGNASFRRTMARALGRRVDKGKAGRPAEPEKTWSVPDLLSGVS